MARTGVGIRLGGIWIDDALGRSARCRRLTLSHRCIATLKVEVDHVVVDLKTNRVVWVVSLSPCRRGHMDRPDRQNYQNQNAHQNLHTRMVVEKSSQRPETFRSSARKDIFNSICQKRTLLRSSRSGISLVLTTLAAFPCAGPN